MLDAFIIEELRRREREQRENNDRPALELPIERPREKAPKKDRDDDHDSVNRGIVTIDL
jgi:hypothetical protein